MKFLELHPVHPGPLTAAIQPFSPDTFDEEAHVIERTAVAGDAVIGIVPA